MKIKGRIRNTALVPTVQYGNFTLEAEFGFEDEVSEEAGNEFVKEKIDLLTKETHTRVLESLKEQRKALDDFEANFFKS